MTANNPSAHSAPIKQVVSRGRLLLVVTEDWYFYSHRLELALAAADACYDVHLATRVSGSVTLPDGITVHPLQWQRGRGGKIGDLAALFALIGLIRDLKPDIVHAVALKPIVMAGLAQRLVGKGHLVAAVAGLGYAFTEHSAKARFISAALVRAIRTVAGRPETTFLFQNPDDEQAFRNLGALGTAETKIIRGAGVNTNHFEPLPEPNTTPITIAIVARMLRIKGIETLLAASRVLAQRGIRHRLLLAGAPDAGNPATIPEEKLVSLRLEGTAEWLGAVSDVRTVWSEAHIAVLPSYGGEGLPKSLLEAAACGRPLVATDIPGSREIARDGETALIVPPRDVEALASALSRLIVDGDLRRKLGQNARAKVVYEFSTKTIHAQTLSLYAQIDRQ